MSTRVLHVIDHLGLGGGQMSVKNITENIDSEKFESFVCALRTKPTTIAIKGKVISLQYGKWDPRSISAVIKLCKEHKIDILHAHLQKSIISCLIASYFCRMPVIVHERGAIFRRGIIARIYRVLLRMLHHRAAVIIANSQATARELIKRVGINRDRIKTIYNPVDFASFDPNKISRSQAREEFGISGTDAIIGFVGRLHKVKGVDLLIEAFAMLLEKSRDYRLVLAGDGPQRGRLEALAKRLGVTDRVKFLGIRDDIAAVMSGFDIAVVPSRQEPFGRVAVELMRMKVPMVSSGVEGLAELVRDGQTAVVTSENNPEQICRGIERLLADEQLRNRIVEGAYAFSDQFRIDEHVGKLQKIYTQVLHN